LAARREEAERVRSRAFGRRRDSTRTEFLHGRRFFLDAARNLPPSPTLFPLSPLASPGAARDPDSSATDVRFGFTLDADRNASDSDPIGPVDAFGLFALTKLLLSGNFSMKISCLREYLKCHMPSQMRRSPDG